MAVAVALAGCAATEPPRKARPVAPERIVGAPRATSATPAHIRLTRDTGYIGSAVVMHVSLDGKGVASLQPGEYVDFPADPGEHQLSVLLASTMNDRLPVVVETNWHAGASYRYRLGMDGNLAVNVIREPH